ncbi:MAG: glycosyltransferase [Ferruginibacter sp.]
MKSVIPKVNIYIKTIFICIDWFHPAYKAGGPVQSVANLVAQYDHKDVEFRIFTSAADLDGTVNEGVQFDAWNRYNGNTMVWYASTNRRSLEAMKREINNCGADILFIVGVFSWYFKQVHLALYKVPVKIISARGMLHPGALSQKSLKKKIYLAFWKMAGITHRYFFHATDMQEKGFIQQVFGKKAKVFVAGNFPHVFTLQPATHKSAGSLQMVSIALISSMKNISIVLDALQQCSSRIVYDIYGPVKDEAYWQQCLEKIKELPANIRVTYKGDIIPTKIEQVLTNYEIFILPSKSENFGHAIYEALSAGKPVITSHHTPFNNLSDHKAGQNVSVQSVPEITAAIDFFAAMAQDEFSDWNIGANNYAIKQIDTNKIKVQYDEMFGVGG